MLLFRDVDSRSDELLPLPLPVYRRDADATDVANRSIGPDDPLGEVEAVVVREHLLNCLRNELPILRVYERHVLGYARSLEKMLTDHHGFDFTKRIVRPDGTIRH